MKAKLLDGKKVSQVIKDQVRAQIQEHKLKPVLEIITVGSLHTGIKDDCQEVGIELVVTELPEDVKYEYDVMQAIWQSQADGIFVQLPLPNHLNQHIITSAIPCAKDVGCYKNTNLGNLFNDDGVFSPCTPLGIMELLWEYHIELVGKHCVVVGRSDMVGKPLALMLINAGATVTVCNSHTQNLSEITRQADILISTVGKPNLINANMVKYGAVIVDVGVVKTESGEVCGSVDFEEVSNVAGWITSVIDGVGLMTKAMLLQNTVWACENKQQEGSCI